MNPGALRHKLTIEAATRTDDGGGGAEVGWHPVGEAWAEIVPLSGKEELTAEKPTRYTSSRIAALLVVDR